jgi:RhtB (resistance to homoserine/threonine) family protein
MSSYWPEFLKLSLVHLLAVASPGPDFALVLKQSIKSGRKTAIWTAFGIGSGILFHASYSLLGLGVLLSSSPFAFTVVKWIGASYLAYLGYCSLRAKPTNLLIAHSKGGESINQAPLEAWKTGFIVNIFNPKCALFCIAFFVTVVSPFTPLPLKAVYSVWIALMTFIWFSFVGYVFTREKIRTAFLRQGYLIDRVLGVVFIAFALSIAFTALR